MGGGAIRFNWGNLVATTAIGLALLSTIAMTWLLSSTAWVSPSPAPAKSRLRNGPLLLPEQWALSREDRHHSGASDVFSVWVEQKGRPATAAAVRLARGVSERALREAIAGALGVSLSTSAQVKLHASNGDSVAVNAAVLTDGAHYIVEILSDLAGDSSPRLPAAKAGDNSAELAVVAAERDTLRTAIAELRREQQHRVARGHGGDEEKRGGVTLSGRPAQLPRVVLASLGTGRYRGIAIAALESAGKRFGGDCEVSLHLLSDDIQNVAEKYNPAVAPYREWPQSGLSKFEDILNALEPIIEAADFFYFMDGDVRFNENVSLADVAGDLVGVEHPFYPAGYFGYCKPDAPARDRGFCGVPYDRNPKSQIRIPDEYGRFFSKVTSTIGGKRAGNANGWIVHSNAYYLQSAFWGGKSHFVLEMLKDLRQRVDIDRSHNIYSMVVQDERYVNCKFVWSTSALVTPLFFLFLYLNSVLMCNGFRSHARLLLEEEHRSEY